MLFPPAAKSIGRRHVGLEDACIVTAPLQNAIAGEVAPDDL
jgi:hypothetical protein